MARRRFQMGYVFLRGGKWNGRYREDVIQANGEVKRVQKCIPLGTKREYPTKRLAERRMEVLLARVNAHDYRPGRVATVAEFAERWKMEVLSKRKPSTIHTCQSHLKIQIIPQLGTLRLDEIGVENQQVFINRIAGKLSRKMLMNVLATLSSMLRTARNWGYVCQPIDMEKLVVPARVPQEPAPTFTAEQVSAILGMAKGQYRAMFAIAAMAGLRVGEILGLQVGDFDFEKQLFRVGRSVWRGKVQTPKSMHSQAVLPLSNVLAEIVRAHIKTLKEGQSYLFLNQRGKLFIAENVARQALVPILDALKIPRCGFHAFRHAHTSLLLHTGATPKVVQAQLRHADPRVTIALYGHIIGDAQRQAVNQVSDLCSNVLYGEPASHLIQ